MSKYFTEGYVIDTKKADLIAERETDTEFGIYKYSVYRTKKSKKFFRIEETNYKSNENESRSAVIPMTEEDARNYLEYNFQGYEINWKKFFELEEY